MMPATTMSHSLPARIKAVRVPQYGSPEVIIVEDVDRPQPSANEVLVQVHAAGVGPWDAWIRAGRSVLPQPLPLTLGSDLSGVVAMTGTGVTDFQVDQAVFGVTNPQFTGAYAQYAIARASMIAAKPSRLDDVNAASVPVVGVTAWQALFEQAQLRRGQTVLIQGAAGNVGAYAVQLACHAGLNVFATAGTGDIDYVRCLGAHTVIDYRTTPFEQTVTAVDAVVDLVGGETQTRSFGVLKRGGILVSAVSQPDQELAARHGVKATFFLVEVTTERLTHIAAMVDQGTLKTKVGAVLPLDAARMAHEMLDGLRPHPRGKIVLQVR